MSMVRCDQCSRAIDSDDDPDCFIEEDRVLCESCRDEQEEEE
jgi:hypothetical protein